MENNVQKENETKKITFLVVAILVLMITVSGGTYAYFALSANNTTAINGTTASGSLSLSVSQQTLGGTSSGSPQSGVMVPQKEATLGTAIGNGYKCIDGNGNTVCKVYAITVTNNSSAAVVVDGNITFNYANSSGFTNLKWRKITNATTLGSNTTQSASTTAQALVSDQRLEKSGTSGNSNTVYVVVWIQEASVDQTLSDHGSFTATITYTGDDGKGITSTIV